MLAISTNNNNNNNNNNNGGEDNPRDEDRDRDQEINRETAATTPQRKRKAPNELIMEVSKHLN